MKKIFLFTSIMLCVFLLVGCDRYRKETNKISLSDEIMVKIKQGYVDLILNKDIPIDNVTIEVYYGQYHNYEVVLIKELNKGDTGVEKTVDIEGITFQYSFGNREILLWNGIEFYNLLEAFEHKLIFKEDLEKIKNIHDGIFIK